MLAPIFDAYLGRLCRLREQSSSIVVSSSIIDIHGRF